MNKSFQQTFIEFLPGIASKKKVPENVHQFESLPLKPQSSNCRYIVNIMTHIP